MPEDHLVQLNNNLGVRFITDEQYAVQQQEKRIAHDNMMEDPMPEDHLVQMSNNLGVRFITDEQYAVQQQEKRDAKDNMMEDPMPEDHLVQTRWVELPDCPSGAATERPLESNVNPDNTFNHKESPPLATSATCKTRPAA